MYKVADTSGLQAVTAIARALRNTSFYSIDHPLVRRNTVDAASLIEQILSESQEFVLKVVDGELIVDNQPLFELGRSTANLVGACLRRNIESIAFTRGFCGDEMPVLIDVLSSDPAEPRYHGDLTQCLIGMGVSHIVFEKLHLEPAPRELRPVDDVARESYASALDALRAAARQAGAGAPPEVEPIRQVVGDLIDVIFREQSMMLSLVAVKGRDEYTFTHALHICILCLELGYGMGLYRDELQELGICALLHDIGKIHVPLSILRKPAALEPEEFAVIQKHPLHGALLLSRQPQIPRAAPLVAFEHHIHYDSSGYPRVSHPHVPCFYSLVVGPADVYDALTTDRSYRAALSPQQALEEMARQATQFEPRLLAHFIQMLGGYPAGSLVLLSDGRRAVVTRTASRLKGSSLRVRIVESLPGQEASLCEDEISIVEDGAGDGLSIAHVLDPTVEGLDTQFLLGGSPFCTE